MALDPMKHQINKDGAISCVVRPVVVCDAPLIPSPLPFRRVTWRPAVGGRAERSAANREATMPLHVKTIGQSRAL